MVIVNQAYRAIQTELSTGLSIGLSIGLYNGLTRDSILPYSEPSPMDIAS